MRIPKDFHYMEEYIPYHSWLRFGKCPICGDGQVFKTDVLIRQDSKLYDVMECHDKGHQWGVNINALPIDVIKN